MIVEGRILRTKMELDGNNTKINELNRKLGIRMNTEKRICVDRQKHADLSEPTRLFNPVNYFKRKLKTQ